MREIPSLQVLCLRAVGSQACSAEDTFAADQQTGDPSQASRLLRTFHQRPIVNHDGTGTTAVTDTAAAAKEETIPSIPMTRSLCVGKGSTRRAQANDVDLNHPLIAYRYRADSDSTTPAVSIDWNNNHNLPLVMQYGNPALDCLQSYIDSLVELGRMDDNRLGLHFFEEWRNNVLMGAGKPAIKKIPPPQPAEDETMKRASLLPSSPPPPRKRSRRRSSASLPTSNDTSAPSTTTVSTTSIKIRVVKPQDPSTPPPLGSLSLNNCAIAEETIEAMKDSKMGLHLGVLDLSGIYGLNDMLLQQLLPHCPNLQRLSIKNCRRVTVSSLQLMARYQTKLQCLDIGGTYNVSPDDVIDTIVVGNSSSDSTSNKRRPCPELTELHVSGLGWNDHLMKSVVLGTHDDDEYDEDEEMEGERPPKPELRPWKALSFGFSMNLTSLALRQSLSKVSSTLVSLALHFCEYVVDNALMGMLGRNLPQVRYLDVRGNPSLTSMTGWYDGRASADFNPAGGRGIDGEHEDHHDEEDGDHEDGGANSDVVAQQLTVLARFTGITKASLEDTLRIHPLQAAKLTCIIDSSGTGVGIYR